MAAPTIVSTTGTSAAEFGLTAESGILVEQYNKSAGSNKVEKQDETGNTVLVSYFDPKAVHTLSGVIIGVTGVGNAIVAQAITLANSLIGAGGVTVGTTRVDTVDFSGTNVDFNQISVTATQYPAIT